MLINLFKLPFIFIISTTLLSGCLSLKEKATIKMLEDDLVHLHSIIEEAKNLAPPSIIYRIDEHRFFTLEQYNQKRGGMTYYNNTQKGIHQKILDSSACRYKGRLIWSTDRDDAFAFPSVLSSRYSQCVGTKYGCINVILVTLNGGKRFAPTNAGFGITTYDPEYYSANFDIIVTSDGFYLGKSSYRQQNDELDSPWWRKFYFDPSDSNYIHDDVGDKETPSITLKTPSEQTRFDCSDPAIYPISK
ncbi:TPA: hypothetical protein SMT94_001983 [Proteus mirabilis]